MSACGPEPAPSQTESGNAFKLVMHVLENVVSCIKPCQHVDNLALISASLVVCQSVPKQKLEFMAVQLAAVSVFEFAALISAGAICL